MVSSKNRKAAKAKASAGPQTGADYRAAGNAALAAKKMEDALELYSKGIEATKDDPQELGTLYSNRSAVYNSVGVVEAGRGNWSSATEHYESALSDAERSISLRPDWAKPEGRRAFALWRLCRDYQQILDACHLADEKGGSDDATKIKEELQELIPHYAKAAELVTKLIGLIPEYVGEYGIRELDGHVADVDLGQVRCRLRIDVGKVDMWPSNPAIVKAIWGVARLLLNGVDFDNHITESSRLSGSMPSRDYQHDWMFHECVKPQHRFDEGRGSQSKQLFSVLEGIAMKAADSHASDCLMAVSPKLQELEGYKVLSDAISEIFAVPNALTSGVCKDFGNFHLHGIQPKEQSRHKAKYSEAEWKRKGEGSIFMAELMSRMPYIKPLVHVPLIREEDYGEDGLGAARDMASMMQSPGGMDSFMAGAGLLGSMMEKLPQLPLLDAAEICGMTVGYDAQGAYVERRMPAKGGGKGYGPGGEIVRVVTEYVSTGGTSLGGKGARNAVNMALSDPKVNPNKECVKLKMPGNNGIWVIPSQELISAGKKMNKNAVDMMEMLSGFAKAFEMPGGKGGNPMGGKGGKPFGMM